MLTIEGVNTSFCNELTIEYPVRYVCSLSGFMQRSCRPDSLQLGSPNGDNLIPYIWLYIQEPISFILFPVKNNHFIDVTSQSCLYGVHLH